MSAPVRRSAGPLALAVLALILSGCGFGGFGGDAPETEPRDPIRQYVALGDGFAAAPYVGPMDRARGCLRSKNNYPAQVAARIGAKLTDVSCTSASTAAVLESSEAPAGKGRLPAQLDAVTAETDLVTITIGLSDNQLLYRGFYVCMQVPCGQRIPPQQLAAEAEAVGEAISNIVRAVLDRAPDAYVVLVGYPQITPKSLTCDKIPKLDDLQLAGVNALFIQINGQLQDVARQTGSGYADLSKVTEGHDVCGLAPWVRDTTGKPSPRASLHPLAPEQKAAADLVVTAVEQR